MDAAPDFEALRVERNKEMDKWTREVATTWNVPFESLSNNFNPNSCYCACTTGGPCEHQWNGKGWESEDGLGWSATCSRCECTAMSHDMRVLP